MTIAPAEPKFVRRWNLWLLVDHCEVQHLGVGLHWVERVVQVLVADASARLSPVAPSVVTVLVLPLARAGCPAGFASVQANHEDPQCSLGYFAFA